MFSIDIAARAEIKLKWGKDGKCWIEFEGDRDNPFVELLFTALPPLFGSPTHVLYTPGDYIAITGNDFSDDSSLRATGNTPESAINALVENAIKATGLQDFIQYSRVPEIVEPRTEDGLVIAVSKDEIEAPGDELVKKANESVAYQFQGSVLNTSGQKQPEPKKKQPEPKAKPKSEPKLDPLKNAHSDCESIIKGIIERHSTSKFKHVPLLTLAQCLRYRAEHTRAPSEIRELAGIPYNLAGCFAQTLDKFLMGWYPFKTPDFKEKFWPALEKAVKKASKLQEVGV